jgi:hypothetical protein
VLSHHDDQHEVDQEEQNGRHDQHMEEEEGAPCPERQPTEKAEEQDREHQLGYMEPKCGHRPLSVMSGSSRGELVLKSVYRIG